MVTLATIQRILEGDFDWGQNVSTLVGDLVSMNWFYQRWGLYGVKSGIPAIDFDNVVSIEFKKDWNVSDYPVEQGSFESYNKVQLPFDVRITFSSGGNFSNRAALLRSAKSIAGNLELYDVVTPELTLRNGNITHVEWRRADGHAGLIHLTVWVTEIRDTVYSKYSSSEVQTGGEANGLPVISQDEVWRGNVSPNTIESSTTIMKEFGLPHAVTETGT